MFLGLHVLLELVALVAANDDIPVRIVGTICLRVRVIKLARFPCDLTQTVEATAALTRKEGIKVLTPSEEIYGSQVGRRLVGFLGEIQVRGQEDADLVSGARTIFDLDAHLSKIGFRILRVAASWRLMRTIA